jgi:hypothetical protein
MSTRSSLWAQLQLLVFRDLTPISAVLIAVCSISLIAQQEKPVPKDSVRVFINGCANGQVFIAGPLKEDQPGRSDVKPGMKFRLQGQKAVLNEIKAHKGTEIEITGLIRKGQSEPGGVALGGHVRVTGASPMDNDPTRSANVNQVVLDVEGWRQLDGKCPG